MELIRGLMVSRYGEETFRGIGMLEVDVEQFMAAFRAFCWLTGSLRRVIVEVLAKQIQL